MARDWHRLLGLGAVLVTYGVVCIMGMVFAPFVRPYLNLEASDQFGLGRFHPFVSFMDGIAVIVPICIILILVLGLVLALQRAILFFWPRRL